MHNRAHASDIVSITAAAAAADPLSPTPVQQVCASFFRASSVLSPPLARHQPREAQPRHPPRTTTHMQQQRCADAAACADEFPLEATKAEHHTTWPGEGGGEFDDDDIAKRSMTNKSDADSSNKKSNSNNNLAAAPAPPRDENVAFANKINHDGATTMTPLDAASTCTPISRKSSLIDNNVATTSPLINPTNDATSTGSASLWRFLLCHTTLHHHTPSSPLIDTGAVPSNFTDDARGAASLRSPPHRRCAAKLTLCNELALRDAAFARLAREGVELNPGPTALDASKKENSAPAAAPTGSLDPTKRDLAARMNVQQQQQQQLLLPRPKSSTTAARPDGLARDDDDCGFAPDPAVDYGDDECVCGLDDPAHDDEPLQFMMCNMCPTQAFGAPCIERHFPGWKESYSPVFSKCVVCDPGRACLAAAARGLSAPDPLPAAVAASSSLTESGDAEPKPAAPAEAAAATVTTTRAPSPPPPPPQQQQQQTAAAPARAPPAALTSAARERQVRFDERRAADAERRERAARDAAEAAEAKKRAAEEKKQKKAATLRDAAVAPPPSLTSSATASKKSVATAAATTTTASHRDEADSFMSETPARGADEHSVPHQRLPAVPADATDLTAYHRPAPAAAATAAQRNLESTDFFTSYLTCAAAATAGSHAWVSERVVLPNGTECVVRRTVRLSGACSKYTFDVNRNKDRPAVRDAYVIVCSRPSGPDKPFVESAAMAKRKLKIQTMQWHHTMAMDHDDLEVFAYGAFPIMPADRETITNNVRHLNYVSFKLLDPNSAEYKADKLANHEMITAVLSAQTPNGGPGLWTPIHLRTKEETEAMVDKVLDELHAGQRYPLATRAPLVDNNGAMREAWATLFEKALAGYAEATPEQKERITLHVFALPRMHMRELKGQASQEQRDKFARQQLLGMVCEQKTIVEKERPAAALAAETMSPEDAFDDRCARRAFKLIGMGQVGRGASVLKRPFEKDVKPIRERLAELQELHPAGDPPKLTMPDTPYFTMGNIDGNDEYMKWLQGNLTGVAPGCDGMTFEMIHDFLSRRPGSLRHWLAMHVDLCNGDVSRKVRRLCSASWLVGIGKPGGGTRPLAMGSSISKSAQAIAVRAAMPQLSVLFSKTQHGMEEGGVHKVITMIRRFVREGIAPYSNEKFGPNRCVGAVDQKNAFNSVHRQAMADATAHVPPLQGIFKTCYAEHGELHVVGMPGTTISSARGARQGTGDGPANYSVVAHFFGVMQTTEFRTKGGRHVIIMLFLDDAYILAENIDDLEEAVAHYTQWVGTAGLEVKPSKCEVLFCCDTEEKLVVPPAPSVLAEFRTSQVMKVLGASVGRTDPAESVHLLAREKGRNVDFFRRLLLNTSPQYMSMLLTCAAPILSHVIATHHPSVSQPMSKEHDARLVATLTKWAQCGKLGEVQLAVAMAPKSIGGWGLTSSEAIAPAAYAATLSMVYGTATGAKRIPLKALSTALWNDNIHALRENSPLVVRMLDGNREQGALAGLALTTASVSAPVFGAYLRMLLCAPSYLALGMTDIPCPGTSCAMKLNAAPEFADHVVNCVRVPRGGCSRSHDLLVTKTHRLLIDGGHMPSGDGTRKGEPRHLKGIECGCGLPKMSQDAFAAHKAAGLCPHASSMKVHRSGPDILCESPAGELNLYDVTVVSKHNKTNDGKSTQAIMDAARAGKQSSYGQLALDAGAALVTLVALTNGVLGPELTKIVHAAADRMMVQRHVLRREISAFVAHNSARSILAAEQMAGIAPPPFGMSSLAGRPIIDEAPLTQEERSPRRASSAATADPAAEIISDVVAILIRILGVDLRDLSNGKNAAGVVAAALKHRTEEATARRGAREARGASEQMEQAVASGSPRSITEAVMSHTGNGARIHPIDLAESTCFSARARVEAGTAAAKAALARAMEAGRASSSAAICSINETAAAVKIDMHNEQRLIAAFDRENVMTAERSAVAARELRHATVAFYETERQRKASLDASYNAARAEEEKQRVALETLRARTQRGADIATAGLGLLHDATAAAHAAASASSLELSRRAEQVTQQLDTTLQRVSDGRMQTIRLRADAHQASHALDLRATKAMEAENARSARARAAEVSHAALNRASDSSWAELEHKRLEAMASMDRALQHSRDCEMARAEQQLAAQDQAWHEEMMRRQQEEAERDALEQAERARAVRAQQQQAAQAAHRVSYVQDFGPSAHDDAHAAHEHARRQRSESAAGHRADSAGASYDQQLRNDAHLEHTQMRREHSQTSAAQRDHQHQQQLADEPRLDTDDDLATTDGWDRDTARMEHSAQRRAETDRAREAHEAHEELLGRIHTAAPRPAVAQQRSELVVAKQTARQAVPQAVGGERAEEDEHFQDERFDDPLYSRTTGSSRPRSTAPLVPKTQSHRQQQQPQQQARVMPTHRNPLASYTAPAARDIAFPTNGAGPGMRSAFDGLAQQQREHDGLQDALAELNAARIAEGRTPLRRENGLLLAPDPSPTANVGPGGSFLGQHGPEAFHRHHNHAPTTGGGSAMRSAQHPALPSTVFPSTTTQPSSSLGHVERSSSRNNSSAPASPPPQQPLNRTFFGAIKHTFGRMTGAAGRGPGWTGQRE